jgi:hypothetical protein
VRFLHRLSNPCIRTKVQKPQRAYLLAFRKSTWDRNDTYYPTQALPRSEVVLVCPVNVVEVFHYGILEFFPSFSAIAIMFPPSRKIAHPTKLVSRCLGGVVLETWVAGKEHLEESCGCRLLHFLLHDRLFRFPLPKQVLCFPLPVRRPLRHLMNPLTSTQDHTRRTVTAGGGLVFPLPLVATCENLHRSP